MEFFVLLIPALFVVFMVKQKETSWVLLIPILVCLLSVLTARFFNDRQMGMDTEYWGSLLRSARYEEPWDEKVPCRHPKYKTEIYTDSCGSGKDRHSCTKTRQVRAGNQHSYDVDYHSASWKGEDTTGEEITIDEGFFDSLCFKWKNKTFEDLNRHYFSIDGNAYETRWNGKDVEVAVPLTTIHQWKNPVPASQSLFKFQNVSLEEKTKYGLYNYPVNNLFNCPSILSQSGYKGFEGLKAEGKLSYLNAKLGPLKKIRVWVLIFENQPLKAATLQKSLWQNGNKNELVICIGLNKQHNVQWASVFSWTENEQLKTDCRVQVMETMRDKELDLNPYVTWLEPQIQKGWKKRSWKEFDYLQIPLSNWAWFGILLATFLSCAGTLWFIYEN